MDRNDTEFSTLYRRHSADVLRFAFWLCGHRADAEDIAAETFARAYAGADTLRAESAKAYLLRIARNLVLERQRRHRPNDELDDNTLDESATPERHADAAQSVRRTLTALATLSEPDRAALLLTSHDGLDYRAIALLLGLSLPAVKVRIHRARLRLASALEKSS